MEAIQIDGLTKYYGKARGIIDLSLSVKAGEFFGFIGPNGAGKSTTIRSLLGLISPTSGKASILGNDIVTESKKVLEKCGYLPSETAFYSGMRVREIIKFSAQLRKKDCNKESKELCERLQLDVSRNVDELSFGNRKKVGIVCALQHKPEVLILDEPTSGLDPLMQKEFFEILNERNKEGATIFLSSHVLSEIQRNCTRAAIIKEGKMIACDSVNSLSKTNTKKISVVGDFDVTKLTNARIIQKVQGGTSFLYGGQIQDLIAQLAKSEISDVTIAEPDLEEVFMHFYVNEKANNGEKK